ncbi:MAG: hypothetical protein MSJ26_01805 [Oscillospiraceae bacterium]|nr:hypothetical protein [Oscillospiraceae bacterium]
MIFYTADLHLGHENVICMSERPFENGREMINSIIHNWNSVVTKDDDVYVIGDVFFKMQLEDELTILRRLMGRKHLILGNHDKRFTDERLRKEFVSVENYAVIKDNDRSVVLCHYPLLEWDGYFRGAYHVYGHIHNNFDTPAYRIILNNKEHFERAFNAGVDVNGYTPRTLDEMIQMSENENKTIADM